VTLARIATRRGAAGPAGARLLVALAVACGLLAAPAAAVQDPPRLEQDATLTWSERGTDFGGFSALHLSDGGTRVLALSDRGHWATAVLEREGGRITGARRTGSGPLLGVAGTRLRGRDVDAEAVAVDDRGRAYVAFEQFHRIRLYDRIDAPPTEVPGAPGFEGLRVNAGLEALAIDEDGVLYAVPERSRAWGEPFPVFRLRHGAWDTRGSLPRVGPFLVTGADFGPDGRLYLLERDFQRFRGFRTRVRRFTLGAGGFAGGEILLETRWLELDNMEGISVWRDPAGSIRVTLLSDDNFFPLQRTQLAEYILVGD
jgi:hypothetical protein